MKIDILPKGSIIVNIKGKGVDDMKRLFTLFLAMLMLTLCACGTAVDAPGGSGVNTQTGNGNGGTQSSSAGETAAPTTPQIDYDAPALALTVKINPEFEITLNAMNTILSAKPLNADAESLLAALDVVGQSYYDGIKTVLGEAKTQGYLQDGAAISITAEEKTKGSWTVASKRLLEMPIEAFLTENSISFTCNLTPAGKSSDPQKLELGKTVEGEDPIGEYSCAFYYDYAGYNVMNILTYKDGTRREIYFPQAHINSPVTLERIVITYYPDGRYQHEHYQENQYSYYIQYPDGSWETYIGIGNWSRRESSDGVIWETTLDSNGTVIDEKVTYPEGYTETWQNDDGSTTTITYHDNGNFATVNTTWPNGDYTNSIYREDGTQSSYIEQRDGVYAELTYGPDGTLQMSYNKFSNPGENMPVESIFYYDSNGEATKGRFTYGGGNYMEETYNGDQNHVVFRIQSFGGYYVETTFNADGSGTDRYRNADGTSGTRKFNSKGEIIEDIPDQ